MTGGDMAVSRPAFANGTIMCHRPKGAIKNKDYRPVGIQSMLDCGILDEKNFRSILLTAETEKHPDDNTIYLLSSTLEQWRHGNVEEF